MPALPSVWVLTVDRPALVLGSTQPEPSTAAGPAAGDGVEVVRRRSGGGAVLVEPDSPLWVDVLVPAGDRLWTPDVGRAFLWLGDAWSGALTAAGVAGATVHRGPPRRDRLSRTVCFAGLGTGEVAIGGRKVVGISQRRTRHGALFQCAALLRWDPDRTAALAGVGADLADLADLADGAAPVPIAAAALEQAFLKSLNRW
ncbi:MAG: lipoyl protein ligase domain-containing protein [Acidimicrobiales bacterium]